MFKKILIANRGEIACRIARTCRAMGIAVAGVHSSADEQALHVRSIGESLWIGPAPARDSYLRIDRIIEAARQVGADAIHPGFGFLSEHPDFAQACAQAGIAFIGPDADTLRLFGNKAAAKAQASRLGIPVPQGLETASDDVALLLPQLTALPLPFILKAVAGGGGKGMRVVRDRQELQAHVEAAIREGRAAFGDGRLIAERYLEAPRHVEVQILGDGQGGVIHLWDRECSLQRRHQKVIEEAPVCSLPQPMREQLWQWAVALGRSVDYLGLGTVEFAVTGEGAVFLEVNPRLQVEHPVTEQITGLDLVELQMRAVHDRRLPLAQQDVPAPRGVAVQARLYAEDPAHQFLPCTGTVLHFEAPAQLRCDTGVSVGSVISADYDPMIAKLIASGAGREQALQQLSQGLKHTHVLGLTHNRDFLCALLDDAAVRENRISTEFIDQWLGRAAPAPRDPSALAALAALWLQQQRQQCRQAHGGAWADADKSAWRLGRTQAEGAQAHATIALYEDGQLQDRQGQDRHADLVAFGPRHADGHQEVVLGGTTHQVRIDSAPDLPIGPSFADATDATSTSRTRHHALRVDGRPLQVLAWISENRIEADVAGRHLRLNVQPRHPRHVEDRAASQGKVQAPMMGIVIALHVAQGDAVAAGQRLATIESMKMELPILAPRAGTVKWLGCTVQGKVERHQDLFVIDA